MSRPAQPRLSVVRRADLPVIGDSEAPTLGEAFRAYGAYVARIGTRILGYDDEEIDDLVQDVFTEAAAGLPALRGPGALKGWLATVTVRVAVRRLRARQLRRLLFRSDDRVPTTAAWAGASPEQCATIARVYALL